jgi:hypothetical protein
MNGAGFQMRGLPEKAGFRIGDNHVRIAFTARAVQLRLLHLQNTLPFATGAPGEQMRSRWHVTWACCAAILLPSTLYASRLGGVPR